MIFYFSDITLLFEFFLCISGFFLVNKFPVAFTLVMNTMKVKNISLLNTIFYMFSQLIAIVFQTILGSLLKTSPQFFFYGFIFVYLLPFISILFLKN